MKEFIDENFSFHITIVHQWRNPKTQPGFGRLYIGLGSKNTAQFDLGSKNTAQINLGSKNISQIYLGSKNIVKIQSRSIWALKI